MMLRRRTERKAKMAASSLFKRVASGQDWNPNSPTAPVKRTSSHCRIVNTKPAKQAKTVMPASKVVASSKKTAKVSQKSVPSKVTSPKTKQVVKNGKVKCSEKWELQKTKVKNAGKDGKTIKSDQKVNKKIHLQSTKECVKPANVVNAPVSSKSSTKVMLKSSYSALVLTQKRQKETKVESKEVLKTRVNDVCVKLTKLDVKCLSSEDRVTAEKQGNSRATVTETSCMDKPSVSSLQHDQTHINKDSIAYPSDCFPDIDFLAMLGLVRKSDIKKLEGSPNKLHREAGGKLRRILKPRVMPEMVYRRVTIGKGLSVEGILIDQPKNLESKTVCSVSVASHSKATSSGAVRNNTVLNLERSQAESMAAPEQIPGTASEMDLKEEAEQMSLACESYDISATMDLAMEMSKIREVMLEDGTKESLVGVKSEDNKVVQSPVKEKWPSKKKAPVKQSHPSTIVPDLELGSRRSARHQGHERRAWSHLLRANPDEFEEDKKWKIGTKEQGRSVTKAQSADGSHMDEASSIVTDDANLTSSIEKMSGNTTSLENVEAVEILGKESSLKLENFSSGKSSKGFLLSDQLQNQSVARARTSLNTFRSGSLAGKKRKNSSKEDTAKCSKPSEPQTLSEKKLAMKIEDKKGKQRNEIKVNNNLDGLAMNNFSFLSYRYKENDCKTPHMCSVCWVNDHMYCQNMKRTARDLPPFGGCIHYIPCEHYRLARIASASRMSGSQLSLDSMHFRLVSSNEARGCSQSTSNETVHEWNDDDLLCREEMLDSDSESSSVILPEGTEILGIQLKTRAEQIIQSLGVDRIPESIDLSNASLTSHSKHSDGDGLEADKNVIVEEYGAEVCIESLDENESFKGFHSESDTNALKKPCSKNSEIDVPDFGTLSAKSKSPLNSNPEYSGNVLEPFNKVDSSMRDMVTIFDGTKSSVPKDIQLGHSSSLSVIHVQVQKLDSERIIVTYPRILEETDEMKDGNNFIRKEVKFPTGADEKTLNEFLAQEAVRLVNEGPCEGQKVISWSENPKPTELKQNNDDHLKGISVVSRSKCRTKKRMTVEHSAPNYSRKKKCTEAKSLVQSQYKNVQNEISMQSDIVSPTILVSSVDNLLSCKLENVPRDIQEIWVNAKAGLSGDGTVVLELPSGARSGKFSPVATPALSTYQKEKMMELPSLVCSEVHRMCNGSAISLASLGKSSSKTPLIHSMELLSRVKSSDVIATSLSSDIYNPMQDFNADCTVSRGCRDSVTGGSVADAAGQQSVFHHNNDLCVLTGSDKGVMVDNCANNAIHSNSCETCKSQDFQLDGNQGSSTVCDPDPLIDVKQIPSETGSAPLNADNSQSGLHSLKPIQKIVKQLINIETASLADLLPAGKSTLDHTCVSTSYQSSRLQPDLSEFPVNRVISLSSAQVSSDRVLPVLGQLCTTTDAVIGLVPSSTKTVNSTRVSHPAGLILPVALHTSSSFSGMFPLNIRLPISAGGKMMKPDDTASVNKTFENTIASDQLEQGTFFRLDRLLAGNHGLFVSGPSMPKAGAKIVLARSLGNEFPSTSSAIFTAPFVTKQLPGPVLTTTPGNVVSMDVLQTAYSQCNGNCDATYLGKNSLDGSGAVQSLPVVSTTVDSSDALT